ncbi:MAG: hypothetical protein OQK32_08865 [Gammaproteobacteria bacterium]|nr:hypothetical protein [Gammaproteobacteria bacterium]MCW8922525.1 hypothetical protein [Gammaproteobacteria bacterium]
MIDLSKFTDPYERKARLYPALICLFPIMIGIAISFPKVFSTLSGLVALAAAVGLLQFLSHLARDRGKILEPALFEKWGGMPSVTIFRHRDNNIPSPAKLKYHEILSKISKISAPSKEFEIQEPNKADEIYISWSDYLRGKTRDTKKYHLIFKENINYGFRRNMLGIRWFCVLSAFMGIGLLYIPTFSGSNISDIVVATTLLLATYIAIFVFVVKHQWVKIVADAYGKQLVEAINA